MIVGHIRLRAILFALALPIASCAMENTEASVKNGVAPVDEGSNSEDQPTTTLPIDDTVMEAVDVDRLDTIIVSVGNESVLVHNIDCLWQLKTDTNFGNQILDGPLPQTGQVAKLTRDQLEDLRTDLDTSSKNRKRNLRNPKFPLGTEQYKRYAHWINQEYGLLDRVDDLLGR